MKENWFTLYPDTFIWIKQNVGVIYNSKKTKGFWFKLTYRTREICEELMLTSNLYTTDLSINDMEDAEINNWVNSVINTYDAGFLTPKAEKRPISYPPILKIFNDVDYYTWEKKQGFGGNILNNIHELTFYLNESESGNNEWFHQTIYPLRNCQPLDVEKVISFIRHSKNPFLSNINLVGNIFRYDKYERLLDEIACLPLVCTIKITYKDFYDNILILRKTKFSKLLRFNVLVASSFLTSTWVNLNEINADVTVSVLIASELEYNTFLNQFRNLPVYRDAAIVPIYDGSNLLFFENFVFLDQKDLNKIKLNKREVLMRHVLNINDFGKFTIMSNEEVFANVNFESLGTIDDTVFSMTYKELESQHSWLRTRIQEPCCDCVYQWLCPSPSNYELAIGKPNLCHIKP